MDTLPSAAGGNSATLAKAICSDTKANVTTEGSGINLHEDLTLFSSGGLMKKRKKTKNCSQTKLITKNIILQPEEYCVYSSGSEKF